MRCEYAMRIVYTMSAELICVIYIDHLQFIKIFLESRSLSCTWMEFMSFLLPSSPTLISFVKVCRRLVMLRESEREICDLLYIEDDFFYLNNSLCDDFII